ncbi:MAG TPA: GNAT family N-acetyltransferase, partial [Micromonosporaceae bacterium]
FHLVPGYQGRGIGRRLLERALDYGAGTTGKLLHSSMDPQAMRTYQRAGFALEPTLDATGPVRRSALPSSADVRVGESSDLDFAAQVDRLMRGSAHGPDLELLFAAGARLLIIDRGRRRGYALIDTVPRIVAATDEPTARTLLWTALAESSADEVSVAVLRANQQWAIDVAVHAGLRLAPGGPLCSMGSTGPMTPYLPHTGVL